MHSRNWELLAWQVLENPDLASGSSIRRGQILSPAPACTPPTPPASNGAG